MNSFFSDDEQNHDQVQIQPQQYSCNQQQQQFNYEDAFEEARREEVLRNISQMSVSIQEEQEQHSEVMEILQKRAKKEQKKQQYARKEEMKRLRHQNALEFFRKVKLQMLINFKQSIQSAKQVQPFLANKMCNLLSCLNKQTIEQFQRLRQKSQMNRKRSQFINLIKKIFIQNSIQLKGQARYQAIQAIAYFLQIGLRRIHFIDISAMDLQQFYNLRYDNTKGKKRKMNKQIDILKNKLQRKISQEELSDKNFVSIQQYSFNPNRKSESINMMVSTQSSNTVVSTNSRMQEIRSMKKTFHESYCQVYCPIEQNWELFNLELLSKQSSLELKNTVLEGKAIIGFYSVRNIRYNNQLQFLSKYRMLNHIQIRDQTLQFCDKYELILKRRHRLGCKVLYKTFMRQANAYKSLIMLSNFDQMLIQKQLKQQQEWAKNNFPKSVKEMKISDYFVTPSLVDKYWILKQDAVPIPNIQFHEEKVYYKKDLERVSSRMGWVDEGRMVKQNQIPMKTTENKNKTTSKLFKYNQTELFRFRFDENGDFLLDQDYNSIYVPPNFEVPQGCSIIQQNIEYLCKRNKFRCARIVQGFTMAASHLVPNNIGYLVQTQFKDQILKMYQERQQKLKQKKQSRKTQNVLSLWRKLFKSIIISQQVYNN